RYRPDRRAGFYAGWRCAGDAILTRQETAPPQLARAVLVSHDIRQASRAGVLIAIVAKIGSRLRIVGGVGLDAVGDRIIPARRRRDHRGVVIWVAGVARRIINARPAVSAVALRGQRPANDDTSNHAGDEAVAAIAVAIVVMIVVTIAAVITAGITTTINPAASARLRHRRGGTVSADGRRCDHGRAGTGDADGRRRPIAAVGADTAAVVGFILGEASGRRRHGKNQGQRYRRTHYLW